MNGLQKIGGDFKFIIAVMRYLIFTLLLAACAAPTPTPPRPTTAPLASPAPTAMAATPTPVRTSVPGFTLVPATPLPPTFTPAPCNSDAKFIRDVTVPDFTQIVAGATIDKRWAIRNTGTCEWTREYRVVFVEGMAMNATQEQALYPAKINTEAIVQMTMLAPNTAGDYAGKWQLRDAKGKNFGEVLFIKIKVVTGSVTTPLP